MGLANFACMVADSFRSVKMQRGGRPTCTGFWATLAALVVAYIAFTVWVIQQKRSVTLVSG